MALGFGRLPELYTELEQTVELALDAAAQTIALTANPSDAGIPGLLPQATMDHAIEKLATPPAVWNGE
ncbi:hypothetical protein IVA79_05900 [Bradyrhizobium sp. 138]|uniref:hypothetical protein n=1 Tax=Bradyrhizobium sp. 138 TaxID=2782615 RepID=UPI001FFA9D72|nr:hypothetical protein [Bradyrhizobium sp. 138]MCK1733503.1 hypothetical protein [Bradyrhizobium sp. 138]